MVMIVTRPRSASTQVTVPPSIPKSTTLNGGGATPATAKTITITAAINSGLRRFSPGADGRAYSFAAHGSPYPATADTRLNEWP